MDSESEFIEALVSGDSAAWRQWETRFRPALARIAHREFGLRTEEIEDLFQDLALALWRDGGRQLRSYRHEAPLKSWMCAVWRRRCLDQIRRFRRATPSVFALHPELALHTAGFEVSLTAAQLLSQAHPRDRALLQLHFYGGWSHREIAICFGVSENTIGPDLSRAKFRLKKMVRGGCCQSSPKGGRKGVRHGSAGQPKAMKTGRRAGFSPREALASPPPAGLKSRAD